MARSTGKTQFNVLLPDKLVTQVRVIAEVEDRPTSHLVEEALRDYIDARLSNTEWSDKLQEWKEQQRQKLKVL